MKYLGLIYGSALMLSMSAHAKIDGPQRTYPVKNIIVHATGGPVCNEKGQVTYSNPGTTSGIAKYLERDRVLGIHYIAGRDGYIYQSISEDQVANHSAGTDPATSVAYNATTIGIELINRGDGADPYPEAQVRNACTLLGDIAFRYGLSENDVIGHEDIDSRTFTCGGKPYATKQDPGAAFPWDACRSIIKETIQDHTLPACLIDNSLKGEFSGTYRWSDGKTSETGPSNGPAFGIARSGTIMLSALGYTDTFSLRKGKFRKKVSFVDDEGASVRGTISGTVSGGSAGFNTVNGTYSYTSIWSGSGIKERESGAGTFALACQ